MEESYKKPTDSSSSRGAKNISLINGDWNTCASAFHVAARFLFGLWLCLPDMPPNPHRIAQRRKLGSANFHFSTAHDHLFNGSYFVDKTFTYLLYQILGASTQVIRSVLETVIERSMIVE
jgi:hypothetical protein